MNFNSYGNWIKELTGCKVQKISIDGGFSCPNRDGSIGKGGCIYCNNATFNPSYCSDTAKRHSDSNSLMLETANIKSQLEKGKEFFAKKYPDMKYIAYFQSYTNTYAPLPHLKALYEAALDVEGIVGISIATRPDCVSEELLDYLSQLSKRTMVTMEYGVESLNNETLKTINRGHDAEKSIYIIKCTHARGIYVCAHMILGLPDESKAEMLRQAKILSSLPVDIVKLHQLQITRGTILERDKDLQSRCTLFTPEEYVDMVKAYVSTMRDDIVYERFTSQSPDNLLIAPRWGLKNHEFVNMLRNA